MNLYQVKIENLSDLQSIASRIEADERSLAYLYPKSNILHFFAENVDFRAAAFLKQESLARGGDVIVAKHVIDGKTDFSDILLMLTPSQLKSLLEKLRAMDCWGLKEFRESLAKAFTTRNSKIDTKLMAIMNLTPDSFYEASRVKESEILTKAEKFLTEGADFLDLGAESTRPGASPVSQDEEIERLIPALKILRKEFPDVCISVDTYKAETAHAALCEGANLINDISGCSDEMLKVIRLADCPYVLSHNKFNPKNSDSENILSELDSYFTQKIELLVNNGVRRDSLILDPGIGFGKSQNDNFKIIKNIEFMKKFDLPIMIGHSRKRLTEHELSSTLAITAMLYGRVDILRVHDVKDNRNALLTAEKIYRGRL